MADNHIDHTEKSADVYCLSGQDYIMHEPNYRDGIAFVFPMIALSEGGYFLDVFVPYGNKTNLAQLITDVFDLLRKI